MPTPLDQPLLQDSLEALPGWEGSTDAIHRQVQLPADQDEQLRQRVADDAVTWDHEPQVERVEGGTLFTLRTDEVGGVSELDIAFASRISDLAHQLEEGEAGVEAEREGPPEVADEPMPAEQEPRVRFHPAKNRLRS